MTSERPRYKLLYTDTGGTFTDTFVVDEKGNFIVTRPRVRPTILQRAILTLWAKPPKRSASP